MRILFCKVSCMKYYKGHCSADTPFNGGKYVDENGFGHEEYNFYPVSIDAGEDECLGFVEPKSNGGRRNTFHLEKIEGCSSMKDEPCVEDVLVVWCATRQRGDTVVVGWYKHATVWRELQPWTLIDEGGEEEERCFNVNAKASDCTLLPENERNKSVWSTVPLAKKTRAHGFGQSMVWYPTEETSRPYLARLTESIDNYQGENWLYTFPET